jgi:hypothetical protein
MARSSTAIKLPLLATAAHSPSGMDLGPRRASLEPTPVLGITTYPRRTTGALYDLWKRQIGYRAEILERCVAGRWQIGWNPLTRPFLAVLALTWATNPPIVGSSSNLRA